MKGKVCTMKKAILLKAFADHAEINIVDFSSHELEDYYRLIDCETIDIVSCYGLHEISLGNITAELVVDDEGLFTETPIVNIPASLLYGVQQHGQPIVGNALVVKPIETPDGVEETGFDDEEIKSILKALDIMLEGVMG